MLNKQSTFIQNLRNSKGQVALFIALIFQVLFLFFAMVINVGLLVHHKINLQNSVDLAAYYGAMKQAEGMNVIAHTNYQIRQSWKLLAWRYRMLGSAGDFTEHPFSKQTKRLQNGDDDAINPAQEGFYNAPAFCITYIPFKPMPPDENTCKDIRNLSGIKVFNVPGVMIDLPGVSNAVRNLSALLRDKAFQRCKDFGSFNYIMLGKFAVAYNIDQANRMLLMSYLSHAMSPDSPTSDFYDIDGASVVTGMKKTLLNNLTAANRASIGDADFKTYNSLGDSRCNKVGVAPGAPAKWLTPIKIMPGFVYTDTECNPGDGSIRPLKKIMGTEEGNLPKHWKETPTDLQVAIKEIIPFIGMRNPLENIYNFSLGVEKNPWCMPYVGASAVARPKIPFSPFGTVELKARAFYKPFGGRIGPWFYEKWVSRDTPGKGSGPGGRIDPNISPRIHDVGNVGDPTDPNRAPNFSRFVGDEIGLKSRRALFQYGRSIYSLDPGWAQQAGLSSGLAVGAPGQDDSPNFEHWRHIPFQFYEKGESQDILAWDSEKNQPSRMRELELSAILPDAYDLAYYSIEPNFYHTYYKRIRDGFLKGPGAGYYGEKKEFLGDIGTHKGYQSGGINYDEFSVKDQYLVVEKSPHLKAQVDIANKLTYISTKWEEVLTGWAPQDLMNYSISANKFGKCSSYPKEGVPTSGNCAAGGSTGYSVKMVSSDFLKAEIPNIGGEGVSGPILNPPPDDF